MALSLEKQTRTGTVTTVHSVEDEDRTETEQRVARRSQLFGQCPKLRILMRFSHLRGMSKPSERIRGRGFIPAPRTAGVIVCRTDIARGGLKTRKGQVTRQARASLPDLESREARRRTIKIVSLAAYCALQEHARAFEMIPQRRVALLPLLTPQLLTYCLCFGGGLEPYIFFTLLPKAPAICWTGCMIQ